MHLEVGSLLAGLPLDEAGLRISGDLPASPASVALPGHGLGEGVGAGGPALSGQRAEVSLSPASRVGDSAQIASSGAAGAGAQAPVVGGAAVAGEYLLWLLLVLGLGASLWLSWRRGGSRERWAGRRSGRDARGDSLLPLPGFRPGTPHERLHDPTYLQRMLEAERLSEGAAPGERSDEAKSGS